MNTGRVRRGARVEAKAVSARETALWWMLATGVLVAGALAVSSM